MYFVNKDLSIYATRGDAVVLAVGANNNGVPYVFQPGEVVRFRVFEKKGCHCTVLQKDFIITDAVESVDIVLTKNETEIGEIISKPKDYWYEIELNPNYNPQTIVGYDDDGPKVFRLFPEGADVAGGEGEAPDEYVPAIGGYLPYVTEEDNGKTVRVVDGKWELAGGGADITVDEELSLTSTNPVQNCVVTREIGNVATAADTAQSTANAAQETANTAGQLAGSTNQLVNNEVIPRITALEQGGTGGGGSAEYNRVSVRDYGAVGDGVADDRGAIIAAFEAAKSMLPCEVYFPAGTYGISNGITVEMAYGTGGLLVRGAGSDITTIKYLDSYDPDQLGNMWYAIRIWPVGMQLLGENKVTPSTEDEWLHDISYTGLTVYDPDPCAHTWHTAKGDPSNEETHGVDIHYCKGVSVTDCQFITVGDEAIDICNCHDVVVMNNRLVGSPGAGPGGGAISIGDGCKGVVVCGNTVNGCAPDETLDNGTVIKKSNYGIAVESLFVPVQDVTITGNTILNMHGKGINLGATNEGAGITNVIIADNVIRSCDLGIRLSGALPKDNIKIADNLICDILEQAVWTSKAVNLTICGNTIRNIKGDYALHTAIYGGDSRQFIADNVFENIEYGAVYCNGNVVLKDCVFNGLGTAETARTTNTYGIYRTGGTLTVSGCVFKDVRMLTLKTCLQDVDYIDNTDVEVVNKTTGVVDGGGASVSGTAVKRIIGCSLIGRIDIKQDNAIVQGTKIVYAGSAHAVTVSANRVSITGCVIENNSSSSSYKAINETSGYNYNLFANNIVNRTITTTGAQSVAVNNIDTRTTA